MALTFEDLLAPVTDLGRDFDAAIAPWRWLIKEQSRPLLISALGDLFIEAGTAVYFLNTLTGTLDRVAETVDAWKEEMHNAQRIGEWFWPGFVEALLKEGQRLQPGDVYSPTIPPVLGGAMSVENFTPSNWRMHLHVLGQIHEQVRDLPPGTRIRKIKVDPL